MYNYIINQIYSSPLNSNINTLSSNKQERMTVKTLNETHTNGGDGKLTLYPFQATEDCVVMFNYKVTDGSGYTTFSASKTDINSNWLAGINTVYSDSRKLIGNSGLVPLVKGEKISLVLNGGVASESIKLLGSAVVFKYN